MCNAGPLCFPVWLTAHSRRSSVCRTLCCPPKCSLAAFSWVCDSSFYRISLAVGSNSLTFKPRTTTYRIKSGLWPTNLTDVIPLVSAKVTRSDLRSGVNTDFCVPRRTKFAERAFSYSGPCDWNSLLKHSLGFHHQFFQTSVRCASIKIRFLFPSVSLCSTSVLFAVTGG